MMTTDALVGVAAFAGVILIFYWPWQETVIALTRQIVFEERDAIFDMAADGELEFDSPEYKEIRRALNQLIRFTHELTWLRFVLHLRGMAVRGELTKESALSLAIKKIEDPKVRAKVVERVSKAQAAMAAAMGLRSLIVMIPTAVVILILWPAGQLQRFGRGIVKYGFGDRVQREAERLA